MSYAGVVPQTERRKSDGDRKARDISESIRELERDRDCSCNRLSRGITNP
jgi:hypothetical protein